MKNITIVFNSDTDNYYNEESGRKSNTVRRIRKGDERFKLLNQMCQVNNESFCKVKIRHSQNLLEFFIRRITNVTYYGGYYIISWRPL